MRLILVPFLDQLTEKENSWTFHAGKCQTAQTANGCMGSAAAFGEQRMS